jgi:hypothetical protein
MDYRWLHSLQSSKDCWFPEAIHGFQAFVPQRTSMIVPATLALLEQSLE